MCNCQKMTGKTVSGLIFSRTLSFFKNSSLFCYCSLVPRSSNGFCRCFAFQIGKICCHHCIIRHFQFRKCLPVNSNHKRLLVPVRRKADCEKENWRIREQWAAVTRKKRLPFCKKMGTGSWRRISGTGEARST